MPTLMIHEFNSLQLNGGTSPVEAVVLPPLVSQTPVTFTGASVQSAILGASTRLVRVMSDANCLIEVGASPTATASSFPLTANADYHFQVSPGTSLRLAVVAR